MPISSSSSSSSDGLAQLACISARLPCDTSREEDPARLPFWRGLIPRIVLDSEITLILHFSFREKNGSIALKARL